jgi:hypothetical protein
MSDLQTVWRARTDAQVLDALTCLSDYNDEAQAIIRAEGTRRRLDAPPIEPPALPGDIDGVARLHRVFVALVAVQWSSLLYAIVLLDELPRALAPLLTPVAQLLLIGTVLAVPIVGSRLLKRLEVGAGFAMMFYAPLVGLLAVLSFPYIAAAWARRHGVDVGVLGVKQRGPHAP